MKSAHQVLGTTGFFRRFNFHLEMAREPSVCSCGASAATGQMELGQMAH